jgi:hypothetical protein
VSAKRKKKINLNHLFMLAWAWLFRATPGMDNKRSMRGNKQMKTRTFTARSLALAALGLFSIARADMVTDWNANMQHALKTAYGTTPPLMGRAAAIVQTAVYDAVNGIEQVYEPYFVTEAAPPGARPEAAAAAAAYTALAVLFPAQRATFDAEFQSSLASIPGSQGNSQSIAQGLAWGAHVANLILASRGTDGITASLPPYFGGTGPGVWRSIATPTSLDGTLPAAFPQLAILTPFALASPSQFRPGPPPDLTSQQYANDVNEIQAIGGATSSVRTFDQTQTAKLWAAVDVSDENQVARAVLPPGASLVDNARILALANIVVADCLIASFDSKYTYNLWRPYHAIRLADPTINPLLQTDPTWTTWTSLIPAPRFQEYVSNHAILTGGFMRTLADLVGDEHTFMLSSPTYPSYTITYERLSDAAAEVGLARMWGGIHFRNSVNVGGAMGIAIAEYVVSNFLRPVAEEE